MGARIIAERGTHLLVGDGARYAVIERRDGRFYNCHDDRRAAVADLSAIGQLLDDGDWTDRQTATAAFDDVVARGSQLAQRM
jgi:hypothetical protein